MKTLEQDKIKVLVERIGCSQIPVGADPHLRGDVQDIFTQFRVEDGPAIPEVTNERGRFILRQDDNFPDT